MTFTRTAAPASARSKISMQRQWRTCAIPRQYYRPDNAILVVSGNFDPAQLDRGSISISATSRARTDAIPRDYPTEPERTQPREYTVYAPNVPLPAVMISYPQPASTDPDIPVLMVIDGILSEGNPRVSTIRWSMSSRSRRRCSRTSKRRRIRAPMACSRFSRKAKPLSSGQAALAAQIARMRDELVTQASWTKPRTRSSPRRCSSAKPPEGRADELADSVIRYGDAAYADRLLAAIQATTAADIQRVARRIFNENRRASCGICRKQEGATGDTIATSPTIQARRLDIPQSEIPTYTLAAEGEREAPPAAGTPVMHASRKRRRAHWRTVFA
jgi:zinc protease